LFFKNLISPPVTPERSNFPESSQQIKGKYPHGSYSSRKMKKSGVSKTAMSFAGIKKKNYVNKYPALSFKGYYMKKVNC